MFSSKWLAFFRGAHHIPISYVVSIFNESGIHIYSRPETKKKKKKEQTPVGEPTLIEGTGGTAKRPYFLYKAPQPQNFIAIRLNKAMGFSQR